MPLSHHSVFTGRMPFLTPNQQCQSPEGISKQQINRNTFQVCRANELSGYLPVISVACINYLLNANFTAST